MQNPKVKGCTVCGRCCRRLDIADFDAEYFPKEWKEEDVGFWYKYKRDIVLFHPFTNEKITIKHDLIMDETLELIDTWMENPSGYWIKFGRILLRIPIPCRRLMGKECGIFFDAARPKVCHSYLCISAKDRGNRRLPASTGNRKVKRV